MGGENGEAVFMKQKGKQNHEVVLLAFLLHACPSGTPPPILYLPHN
jgi:hypothetical protein